MRKLALALALMAGSAHAGWQLNNQQSSLKFVTVKNDVVAETHSLKKLSGQLNDDGSFTVSIDVASLDTLIPIRNERMLEHLFKAKQFAAITASGKVEAGKLASLATGASLLETLPLQLTIAGVTQTVNAAVKIVKLSDKQLLAFTEAPVLVKAADFKLESGVKTLQDLAKLNRIELVVPVTFQVTFSQ